MLILLSALMSTLCSMFHSRAVLELENMALRHQIGVLKRSARKRPKLTPADRLFWVFLSWVWGDWRSPLDIVKPATAIAWHRKGFRLFWTWKIRHGRAGRPAVSCEVRDLIRSGAQSRRSGCRAEARLAYTNPSIRGRNVDARQRWTSVTP